MLVQSPALESLIQTAIHAGLAERRTLLLSTFSAGMRATLPVLNDSQPQDQLRHDLVTLNGRDPLAGRRPPLVRWLAVATAVATGDARRSGARSPRWGTPTWSRPSTRGRRR